VHFLLETKYLGEADMDFGLSLEIAEDIYDKSTVLNTLSNSIEHYFKDRNYGSGIVNLTIGLICVPPQMESFFKVRRKYTKSRRTLEYDVRLDYALVKRADCAGLVAMAEKAILGSSSTIELLRIIDFDTASFFSDLDEYFKNEAFNRCTSS
jgi:hypothetical protein